jgi:hypothetical protein
MIRYVTILVFSAFVMFLPARGIAQQTGGGKMVSRHDGLEQKASLANANDANSISALVDEVFTFPRAFPRMPDFMESGVKDRVVQAELSYRRGVTAGVHEEAVVKAVNELASKFNVPDYAMTSVHQIRALRIGLSLHEPKFMGTGTARENAKVGESINLIMSPAQAVHLIGTLIDQKLLNEEYQVPPTEWDRDLHQKVLERFRTESLAAPAHAKAGDVAMGVAYKRYSHKSKVGGCARCSCICIREGTCPS